MANNIHQPRKPHKLRATVLALATGLAFSVTPLLAQAAGLGKIVVFSALGQPLRAEIELSASREELSGMKASMASPEAFKQAGLDYASTLMGIRFSLDKRPSGQPVIKVSTATPINDPFVDMLLELNWPTGRLVREYTFLLDPPEVAAKNAQASLSTVVSKPRATTGAAIPPPKAGGDAAKGQFIDLRSRPAETSTEKVPEKVAEKSADTAAEGRSHEVRHGETLNKIARENMPEGISLEQMLVGLLRANQDAFDGANMNRLKSGRILTIPEKSALASVAPEEAKKLVMAQSSDWNAYRSKLAGIAAKTPVVESGSSQESSGKITAKVEDKAAPVVLPKDQLKVSKSGAAQGKGGGVGGRSDEDEIAREKALKEAHERVAALEKNVANLQKLLELKNQSLAELQKQASEQAKPAVAPPVPAEPAPAPVPVPAPVAPPPAPEPAPAPVPPPAVPAPAPEVKPAEQPLEPAAEVKPVEKPAEPAPEVKPEEVKPVAPPPAPEPAEKPKPKPVPPPPPPPEPDFIEELLDNPMLLGAGGGILALLGAYAVIRRRRASQGEASLNAMSTLSVPSSSLTANSIFRSTGGQSVDTSNAPIHTDFSQAGPGSIDTDEVDPVAEADVYMAYGRDAQAEEILIEAKSKEPRRFAIHLKLLEIYSNRKDAKAFEKVANELYNETGGSGVDWEKAVVLGLKLDPTNPLYGGGEVVTAPVTPVASAFDPDATVVVQSSKQNNALNTTVIAPSVELFPSHNEAVPAEEPVAAVSADDLNSSLDFDLGVSEPEPPAPVPPAPAPLKSPVPAAEMAETYRFPEPVAEVAPLDFVLTTALAEPVETPETATVIVPATLLSTTPLPMQTESMTQTVLSNAPEEIDFSFGDALPTANSSAAAGRSDDNLVEFDVSLTESTILGNVGQPLDDAEDLSLEPMFDLSSIDLDLGAPEVAAAEVTPPSNNAALDFSLATQVFPAASAAVDTPSRDQVETLVNPLLAGEDDMAVPDFELDSSEEVATKLDLAKAYEDMGDLEGARELLQEVIKEGNPSQREKAQSVLAKLDA